MNESGGGEKAIKEQCKSVKEGLRHICTGEGNTQLCES